MDDISTKKHPKYQDVDGFRIPRLFSAQAFRSCLHYKPRADDVFIVTFPKCGTTWMQQIVRLIQHRGEPFQDAYDFFISSPFLEFTGADAMDIMPRPGGIKLHLPFYMTPYSPEAKYIFVARNPKDACVSFFHHHRLLPMYDFSDGEFDVFFEYFINGKTDFGEYFDTHISWYDRRNDSNVLFLTFEGLKKQPKENILDIAKFLGKEYYEPLAKDGSLLETVVQRSGFKYMKERYVFYEDMYGSLLEAINEGKVLPSGCIQFVQNISKSIVDKGNVDKDDKGTRSEAFFRKGDVGDWKSLFTDEHELRLKERITKKTKGSDFMTLWEDL